MIKKTWMIIIAFLCFAGVADAATNIWQAEANVNASYAGNWSLGRAPISSDDILLDGTSIANMIWDEAATNVVASWTQMPGYTGSVTFETVYGNTGFTNFTITGDAVVKGGIWTHSVNSSTESKRLSVTIGGDFDLDGATITGDSLGYGDGKGPGAPPGGSGQYEGGTHGGIGGLYGVTQTVILQTYGSVDKPESLGSGGQNSPGGGAVRLNVAGTTTIAGNGVITVEGSKVSYGGGAGGSIWLTTGWLAGSGTLRANGGNSSRGNGGGGRVSIVLTGNGSDFSSWNGTNTAYGGWMGGKAAAGTVHRETASGWQQLLIVNNGQTTVDRVVTRMPESSVVDLNAYDEIVIDRMGILGTATSTVFDMGLVNVKLKDNVNSVIDIGADDNLTYPANWVISNVTIRAQGAQKTLENVTIVDSGVLSHQANAATEVSKLNLTIAGNLTVLSNGVINADGRGYASGKGPGGGANQWFAGAHGGVGNASASYGPPTTNTYGNIKEPTTLGSGGNVYGGGAVILNVAGTTTVANGGKITANGLFAGSGRGGGAGGSVYLTTWQLAGEGSICADGMGDRGGGGGRVAVYITGGDFSGFGGKITAYGGIGGGGPGTVYLKPATGSDRLVIDNNGQDTVDSAMARMPLDPAVDLTVFDEIVLQNRGVIGIVSNTVFNMALPNVTLVDNVNSVIDIISDYGVTYPSDLVISNVTVRGEGILKPLQNVIVENTGILSHQANLNEEEHNLDLEISGNLTVLSGGRISADGKGYRGGRGPGAGSGEWFGGGYGGYAGGSSNPKFTAKSYGSVLRPVNIGSGGGNPYGGGAIRLRVAGALDISGTVTANGGDWGSSRGGGSGGSIWITALAMSGDGSISANGGNSGGGGGRIAIELGADGWDNWDGTVNAHGGAGAYCGAAGTIRKWDPSMTAHDGLVLVDNNSNVTVTNAIITPLPAFAESTETLARTAWHVSGKGNLALLAGAEIEELEMDAQTRLELNGEKLVVGRLVVDTVRFPIGTYTVADSPLFTDVIGTGEIQVVGSKHVGLIVVR